MTYEPQKVGKVLPFCDLSPPPALQAVEEGKREQAVLVPDKKIKSLAKFSFCSLIHQLKGGTGTIQAQPEHQHAGFFPFCGWQSLEP